MSNIPLRRKPSDLSDAFLHSWTGIRSAYPPVHIFIDDFGVVLGRLVLLDNIPESYSQRDYVIYSHLEWPMIPRMK